MTISTLQDMVAKYKTLGIVKATDFLLTPEYALELLYDLKTLSIRVVGCDCWRYLDRELRDPNRILEIVGGGVLVKGAYTKSIEENALIIEDFIMHNLPNDADLISLIDDDPKIPGPFSYLFRDNKE